MVVILLSVVLSVIIFLSVVLSKLLMQSLMKLIHTYACFKCSVIGVGSNYFG